MKSLLKAVPPEIFKNFKIARLDIAWDFINVSPSFLKYKLLLNYTQINTRWISKPGKDETFYHGNIQTKQYKAYNKRQLLEDKNQEVAESIKSISRLEISLKRKRNLPTQGYSITLILR